MILAGVLTLMLCLLQLQSSVGDGSGVIAKDMKFKLHSGDYIPAVGCKFYIKKLDEFLKINFVNLFDIFDK